MGKSGLYACLVLAWLAAGCQDTTRPSVDRALDGDWEFDAAFGAGTATCHVRGQGSIEEIADSLVGTVTAHENGCGFPFGGPLVSGRRDAGQATFTAGSCTFSVTVVGQPPDSLAGTVSCGATAGGFGAGRLGAVATVEVLPVDSVLWPGDHLAFTAVVRDAAGRRRYQAAMSWTASAPAVAAVSPDGIVTALAPGSATITAMADGLQGTTGLEVVQPSYRSIGAADYFSCGLTWGGEVRCWGGAWMPTGAPAAVTGAPALVALAMGGLRACGLTAGGEAYCWLEDRVASHVAVGHQFTSLAVRGSVCGLKADGSAWCGVSGQNPTQVGDGLVFRSLAVGGFHRCGIADAGAMYCWGNNWHGMLGTGDSLDRQSPTLVVGGLSFTEVAAGVYSTCGVATDGETYCWGGCVGEIGNGVDLSSKVPVRVTGGLRMSGLSSSRYHYCGRDGSGDAVCWGLNDDGQLGDGRTDTVRLSPAPVLGGLSFREVAAGAFHSCGITSRGIAYCWGWNLQGQLGDGSTTERDYPVRVLGQP